MNSSAKGITHVGHAFLDTGRFSFGVIPLSLLMRKLLANKDICIVGDGNPGGRYAINAGGMKAGIPAVILDIGKGFLPVFLAQKYGLTGWSLYPLSLALFIAATIRSFFQTANGTATWKDRLLDRAAMRWL